MIIKNSSVKIDNLHSILKELIPKLDALHKEFTSNPLVITSGNDDIHWGGIKEKNRPLNWDKMTEEEVREFSDTAHYLDEAFDFRKKCPYKKKTYFNNLSRVDKELFLKRAREIFPKQKFDVVECPFCLHVEWDPKWIKKIPQKPPEDYVIPEVPESPPMPRDYKAPWYKFYRKNGFKRVLGGVTLLTGGILSLIPATSAIGQGILVLGGVIEGLGIGDAVKKKSTKKDDSYGKILFDIIFWLIKYFTKNKEKKS